MAKLLVLGEAPGAEEALLGKPFVGPSGKELLRMFHDASLPTGEHDFLRNETPLINVFQQQPPKNDIGQWCAAKAVVEKEYLDYVPTLRADFPSYPWPVRYEWAKLTQAGYLRPYHLRSLPRLRQSLDVHQPEVVLALGNTPLWALTNSTGITAQRGVFRRSSTPVADVRFLPTFHPAAVLRNYSLRTQVLADLSKLRRELADGPAEATEYDLIIEPSLSEVAEWLNELDLNEYLSVDIETSRGMVMCIGFAAGTTVPSQSGTRMRVRSSICIPILNLDYTSYWGTHLGEILAAIQELLNCSCPKVFQNGLYDLQYIWRVLGMTVLNISDDTMLLHHTLQPELPKGLAFLASVYTQAATWKGMAGLAKFKASELKKDA